MSNADPAEVSVVVSRDGVTVEKSFEPDDFPVPAIAFVIRAERDETVTVRLSDQVPDQVDAEDIGFHPKYGAEFWSVEEGNIVFEREFEAGEEYTTVYGLRASQTDDVESYMSEPSLEEVDPPLDDAGQVVREVIGGDDEADTDGPSSSDIEAAIAAADAETADDTTADDTTGETTDDEPVEPLKLNDPNEGGDVEPEIDAEASDESPAEAGDDDGDEAAIPDAEAGSVGSDPVAALAQQVRTGQADEDDLAALRRALGAEGDGSRDARIKQLQSELADLRAYTNALEEFLDENGDAQQLIQEVKGGVQRLDEQLSTVESRADSAVTRVGQVEGTVERVDGELDDVESEVAEAHEQVDRVESEVTEVTESVDRLEDEIDGLHGDVDEVSEELSTVHEDVESVQSEVAGVHDDVAGVEERVDGVDERVDGIDERVDGVGDRMDDLEADLEEVESSMERVDDLDDRLDSLEAEFADAREDLQSLSQMREQLSSVFGAQVQGPSGDQDDDEGGDGDEE